MDSKEGLFPLTINIKKEKFDSTPNTIVCTDNNNKLSIDVNISNIVSYEKEQKITIEPIKSSNEILTELFKVFNAAPPENLLTSNNSINNNDADSDKKNSVSKKAKKVKHKKKKHKIKKEKTKEKSPPSPEPSKKREKEKSRKGSKDESSHRYHSHEIKKENIDEKEGRKKKKRKSSEILTEDDLNLKDKHRKHRVSDSLSENETGTKEKHWRRHSSDSLSENETETKCKHRRRKDSDLLSENETSSKSKYSSGEYQYKDKDFYRSYESAIKSKDYKSSSGSSKTKEYQDYSKKSSYRDRDRFYSLSRSRSRSRSRTRTTDIHSEKIDKKRLLEIARKNALTMLKNGSLPGALATAEKNILTSMRYEGKSVAELTEYCKKLSNCESLGDLSNISSDGDSDHDRNGNEKAFNHPFQIKDRGPIIMNIKNSTPLPPKTAQQNKAIILQFPVSSGKQHRVNENEWIPVSPKKVAPAPPPVQNPPPQPEPVAPPPKPVVHIEPIVHIPPPPIPLAPPPLIPPLMSFDTNYNEVANYYNEEQQRSSFTYPKPMEESIFPNFPQDCNLDVSQIIAQRLNAMRKLQDNPTDEGAKKLLNNAQKDMSTWASSKFTPGQFLGSNTGANILTPKELSSGYTPWAKKDQLITTNPVSGMGMHLLQKMGWRPGEGLGKDKTGSLQPLLLEVKLDKRGLVAEEEDPRLKKPPPKPPTQIRCTEGKHPVSLLGELASKRKWGAPQYDVVSESGPGHAKSFIFKVRLNGIDYQPTIPSNNKKDAKATAAKFCLQQLGFVST